MKVRRDEVGDSDTRRVSSGKGLAGTSYTICGKEVCEGEKRSVKKIYSRSLEKNHLDPCSAGRRGRGIKNEERESVTVCNAY